MCQHVCDGSHLKLMETFTNESIVLNLKITVSVVNHVQMYAKRNYLEIYPHRSETEIGAKITSKLMNNSEEQICGDQSI